MLGLSASLYWVLGGFGAKAVGRGSFKVLSGQWFSLCFALLYVWS